MKYLCTIVLLTLTIATYAQDLVLPFDFETSPVTADFVDFDGGTAAVLANPSVDGDNGSATVAQIVRDGGADFAGSKLILADFLDFSAEGAITMQVLSPAAGITLKLKLEGSGSSTERDVVTSAANEWETFTWDFTGEPAGTFDELVFMFDFGTVGDGSANSTFYFDNVMQVDLFGGLEQPDLPVTFDNPAVSNLVTDFGDNSTIITEDPTDPSNTVAITTKPESAPGWAGTTMSTPVGFANPIPVTATETVMSVRVYSPDAGIVIRLKIEDHTDPTRSVETEAMTTQANTWETLLFDFSNEATGTAELNLTYTYDMASIFFNFDVDGATAGEKTYYWDDVYFGTQTAVTEIVDLGLQSFPNPVSDELQLRTDYMMDEVLVANATGQQVLRSTPEAQNASLDMSALPAGWYVVQVRTDKGSNSFRIIKID